MMKDNIIQFVTEIDNRQNEQLPNFTGDDRIRIPASGKVRRKMRAILRNINEDIIKKASILYTLEPTITGVKYDNKTNMLIILGGENGVTTSGTTFLKASYTVGGNEYFAKHPIQFEYNPNYKDTPPSDINKPGWKPFYNDEFNGNKLDTTVWSDYYIRHWSNEEEESRGKAKYYFEDGMLVLSTPEDFLPYAPSQNGGVRANSIQTFERRNLHKFGTPGSSAIKTLDIPTFDGFATKYGYFEIRAKQPGTRDGSHFAWWMVGTQDDQNYTFSLASSSNTTPHADHYSNQTGEFDIIESSITNVESGSCNMCDWRPVIHVNGSTDYEYEYLTAMRIDGDPTSEFHTYGFEWDETGTKFYLDGVLKNSSTRSPNYRMMTFFSVYPGHVNMAGYGKDRGVFPKEAMIDYFRVYKKDEPEKPLTIVLNNYKTPDFIKVIETGCTTLKMKAQVLDQFDQPFDANVRWKFSNTIDGFTPETSTDPLLHKVSINEHTGIITVEAGARLNQDLFVTGYLNNLVKETVHIRLDNSLSKPMKLLFNNPIVKTVLSGSTVNLSAKLYDQYKDEMESVVEYQISEDLLGRKQRLIDGVCVSDEGKLTIDSTVSKNTYIVVTAKSGGNYVNASLVVI